MHYEKIVLHHFRSYENTTFSFSPTINLIRGANAQGKTNLLEGIYFLCTGKSFRTNHLKDLIPHGKPLFCLEAHLIKDGVSCTLKASFDGELRRLACNDTLYPSFSPLLGLTPVVLIAPQDVSLINGGPAERRRLLDLHLVQSDPLYTHHLNRYLKAVKQRNALLKQKKDQECSSWENILAISALYLIQKRKETLTDLLPKAQQHLHRLTEGHDHLDLHYLSTFSADRELSSERIAHELQKSRPKELAYGMTLVGPHREDVALYLNGKEAKNFSSEGQKRGLVTALRLAEWQRLKERSGYPPLLGIDDFGVHLDARRYELIQREIQDLGQVFLTTPNPANPTFLCNTTICL